MGLIYISLHLKFSAAHFKVIQIDMEYQGIGYLLYNMLMLYFTNINIRILYYLY